ncbi:MAG TPA: hypothetical protein DCL35_04870 [Candidatus Omnitrophica bacterium]|nr:hypothetical protein [Candidatus Omnitrophota bacterium]
MSVLRSAFVLGIALFMVVAPFAFAQEEQEAGLAAVEQEIVSTPAEQEIVAAPVEQAMEERSEWVWGEVVSVDSDNKQLTIQRLDYDTYEEVQTVLKIDDKTLLENVTDLGQIKPGDHVTVDYKILNGDNVAGLIVVEKKDEQEQPEAVLVPEAPVEEIVPDMAETEALPSTVMPSLDDGPQVNSVSYGDEAVE